MSPGPPPTHYLTLSLCAITWAPTNTRFVIFIVCNITWTPTSNDKTTVPRPYLEGYKGYKDGLQPETLADGNWPVKQNQPVSKIETKSDTNLRSLYEFMSLDSGMH
jgi:hypothetical protein